MLLSTVHLRSSDSFWGENGRQGRVDHLIFNLWVHKLLQFWILSCNLPLFVRSNLLNILELVTHLPEHETNNSEYLLRPNIETWDQLLMMRISKVYLVIVKRDGDFGKTFGFSFSKGSHP